MIPHSCALICDQHHGEESNCFVVQNEPSKCYCCYKSLKVVTAAPVLQYLLLTATFSEKQYMNCLKLMVLARNQLVYLAIHLFPKKKLMLNSSVSSLYNFGYKPMEGCSSLSTHRQEI